MQNTEPNLVKENTDTLMLALMHLLSYFSGSDF